MNKDEFFITIGDEKVFKQSFSVEPGSELSMREIHFIHIFKTDVKFQELKTTIEFAVSQK